MVSSGVNLLIGFSLRTVSVVVIAVSVALFNSVEHHTQQILLPKLRRSFLRKLEIRGTRSHHEEYAVTHVRKYAGIMHSQGWRRIQNDPVEHQGHAVKQLL